MNGIILKVLIIFILITGCALSQNNKENIKQKDLYFGQKPPGKIPELFAPGIISRGMSERDIAITPDGKEIYYGIMAGKIVTIMQTKFKEGKWTEPEIVSFAKNKNYFYLEPCLSLDGNKMFFLSNQPPKGKEPKSGWFYQNLWVVDRKQDGSWSDPYDPGIEINRGFAQYFPSLTKDGTIYFACIDKQGERSTIYRSRFINGKYNTAEKLPDVINKLGEAYNTCIAPDESFLIACIDKKQSFINPNKANYFVFFRDEKDNWSQGIELDSSINIKGSNAMSSYISPDKKYLFFAAQKINNILLPEAGANSVKDIIKFYNSPQNGNYDIYWVDLRVIENFKSKK